MERIFFYKTKSRVFEKTVLIVVGKDFLLILLREGGLVRVIILKRPGALVFVCIFSKGTINTSIFKGKAAQFGNDFREIGAALIFSKPLWGGKFLGLKAPSLRDAISIAVSIASGGAASPMLALALNLVDDLAFTAMDVAMGNMTWDEGLVSLGKAGLSSVVSSQIGNAFGGAMVADPGSIGDVVNNTLVKGMEKFTSNVTVGAINSIEYRSGQGFGFNTSGYIKGLIGTDALASYAGAAVGEFVNSGFQALTLGKYHYNTDDINDPNRRVDGYKNQLGLGLKDADLIKGIGGIVGNAVNAGVEYGISGHTTINILNFSDIAKAFGWDWFQQAATDGEGNVIRVDANGNRVTEGGTILRTGAWNSVGMFELTFDKDRGVSSRIGMNGIDLSIGNFVDAFRGISLLGEISTLDSMIESEEISGDASIAEKKFKLRNQLSFGNDKDREMLERIMAGKDTLSIGSEVKGDGRGFTELINSDGGRNISVYSSGSTDYHTWLAESTILQHEAHRDGKTGTNNDIETKEAVKAHTEMAMKMAGQFGLGFMANDMNLFADVVAYSAGEEAFNEYVGSNYDSSADYWKLRMNPDGTVTLEDDGRGGVFYKDASNNEHEIGKFVEGMSKSKHLANLLGPGVNRNDVLNTINGIDAEYDWDVGAFCYKNQYEGNEWGYSRKKITWNLSMDWSNRLLNRMPSQHEFGIMAGINKISENSKKELNSAEYLENIARMSQGDDPLGITKGIRDFQSSIINGIVSTVKKPFDLLNDNIVTPYSNIIKDLQALAWGQNNENKFEKNEINKDDFYYNDKVSIEFLHKTNDISKDLTCNPNDLLVVMYFETGGTFSSSVENAAGSGAVGLIQFMPSTAIALGTTTEELKKMTNIQQLEYVKKYLYPYKTNFNRIEDLYMAVFSPAYIGKHLDFVTYEHPSASYILNSGFDFNNDNKITYGEITSTIRDYKAGAIKKYGNK